MKLRLAKASQLSWSWGLAWLSLAICAIFRGCLKRKFFHFLDAQDCLLCGVPYICCENDAISIEVILSEIILMEEIWRPKIFLTLYVTHSIPSIVSLFTDVEQMPPCLENCHFDFS